MFDNNKKKNAGKKRSAGKTPSVNMLSEGAKVKGEVFVEDDIRIAGTLEGDLVTKGKAIVTSSGKVDGNIRGKFADIAGNVEGELKISDKVVIRKSAVIEGNVFTKTLLVEEGAQFDGSLHMSKESLEDKLSTDNQAKSAGKKQTASKEAEAAQKKKAGESAD